MIWDSTCVTEIFGVKVSYHTYKSILIYDKRQTWLLKNSNTFTENIIPYPCMNVMLCHSQHLLFVNVHFLPFQFFPLLRECPSSHLLWDLSSHSPKTRRPSGQKFARWTNPSLAFWHLPLLYLERKTRILPFCWRLSLRKACSVLIALAASFGSFHPTASRIPRFPIEQWK